MIIKNTLKAAIASAVVLSLAGCLGNSSGGAPTGGGATTGGTTTGGGTSTGGGATSGGGTSTVAEFDAKALSYVFLVPTQTALSGSADYKGEVSVLTMANANDNTEALIGDLDVNVNFDAGASKPVTATAGNFAGKVNGVDATVIGTLSTANSIANDVNTVTSQTTSVPATLTSATATLRGNIADSTGALAGDARMILGATLMEADGGKLSGGHQTTIFPTDGGTSIATGGSIWADKQP